MPNSTPKKPLDTLAGFAQLAKISVEQILENLQQAGIDIKDPDEKLSSKQKADLLAFLQGKTKSAPKKQKQTVSKLKGTTVTVTRRATKQEEPQAPIQEEPAEEPETQATTTETFEENLEEAPSTDVPSEPLEVFETEAPSERKSAPTKKKSKLEPTKRPKRKLNDFDFATRVLHAGDLPDEDEEKPTPPTPVAKVSFKNNNNNNKRKPLQHNFKQPKPKVTVPRNVWIPEKPIEIATLAKKMDIKARDLMDHLAKLGITVEYPDELLDHETASLLIEEMGHRPRLLFSNAAELELREDIENQMGEPQKRPPIITIMGHVDHGKTSLLDYIRREKVALKEAGGITQHIGAYHVELPKGVITFLDTPGHAAFTAMRARGARLTDIVALVVAADDGVKPQTQEAVEHAQAANVPIVVVVNKMDKPGASMDLAQQGLSKYNLIPEDWGGETLFVAASAKTGKGVDDLLETLLLQAEMIELAAPTKGPAQGIIVESRLDKGRGPVVTMIVQKGTLKKGDILLAGTSYGKIKALTDETGQSITSATPSIPVEVLGLSSAPLAGEEAIVVPNERKAREIAQIRATQARTLQHQAQHNAFDALIDPFKAQLQKSIHVIIKADVQGSAEALKESLVKLSTDEVKIKPLMTGVGNITESDVNLAIASKAIIFAFNTGTDNVAKRLIQQEKVTTYHHSIIYELLDEAKKLVTGLIEPQTKETILGKANVVKTFAGTKKSIIAGCVVSEGTIHINHNIRVLRNQKVIHEGKITSIKRFKDDVKEAKTGTECGISLKNYTDFSEGDIIESYERT